MPTTFAHGKECQYIDVMINPIRKPTITMRYFKGLYSTRIKLVEAKREEIMYYVAYIRERKADVGYGDMTSCCNFAHTSTGSYVNHVTGGFLQVDRNWHTGQLI